MIKKTTKGYVEQTYNKNGTCIRQKFVAGKTDDWMFDKGTDLQKAENTISICESFPMKMVNPVNDAWKDNLCQFARLITEMESAGVFNDDVLSCICNEMDLETSDICELIDRAQKEWENEKVNCIRRVLWGVHKGKTKDKRQ